jgi:hypothetical protein
MNAILGLRLTGATLALTLALLSSAAAAEGNVGLRVTNNAVWLKVDGDKDDDWWLESSANLTTWTRVTNVGTLLSGNATNAAWRSPGAPGSGPTFYRAQQTAGLYDTNLFRRISIVYTQATAAAFSNAMHLAKQFDSNTYLPMLWLENGATNYHVGGRFKGNSSYSGLRRSINFEFDQWATNADLMGFETVNLNNAFSDPTVLREALYFNVMRQYTPCPAGAVCALYANGSLWSVYTLIQQENNELIREYFPSTQGDRWRAPNAPTGGGGMFVSSNSAFAYFTNAASWSNYTAHYALKSTATNTYTAFSRLTNAIITLHTAAPAVWRDRVESVFAVDDWLWMLGLEIAFADDDSYWFKGADYGFYYCPESGQIHPVQHDGNEAFFTGISTTQSPTTGETIFGGKYRPLLFHFLKQPELRQRYLAHLRTVLEENFNPGRLTATIDHFAALSSNTLAVDPRRTGDFAAGLTTLKTYITNRHNYLVTHAELTTPQPNINAVAGPAGPVYATNIPTLQALVTSNAGSGVGSVWLYFRDKSYGRFTGRQMFDDGAHGDGAAGDNAYGAVTTNFPAGNKIHYYVEARAAVSPYAARFSPARAERQTHSYEVSLSAAAATPVVINELLAENVAGLADPQGEYDDWIELRNLTAAPVDLTGLYLTDTPANPRKWPFPNGTTIPAHGYLLVWADENGLATPGLHANFKLAAAGEQVLLIDTDANLNQVLDAITFGPQATDVSYGRTAANADVWGAQTPTPLAANQ